jgi:PAS domain S-box-containing protein
MNSDFISKDPAFSAMTLDILHNMLSRADNPGQLIPYLAEEIRELTGARCTLFIQCLGHTHQVLAINPARYRDWADSEAAHGLYGIAHKLREVDIWGADDASEVSVLLGTAGFALSVAVPLHVGEVQVGAMLVLGLPDQEHLESEIKILNTLSTVVALVLRNAFLFENQEKIIEDRTRELIISGFTLDHMTDAVYWINPDSSLWKVNASACTMLGYSHDEWSTLLIKDICPTFTFEKWKEHWQALKQAGSMNFETVQRRKDGREIPVDISVNYFEFDGKEYNCAIVRDITARKKAEADQLKLQAQFQQAQKIESVGRLAGGVAHDFNNMLGVIIGHAEMAIEKVDPGQSYIADLQEILKAAQRSADLTRQLLAFARKQTIAPKLLDLNETVEGMLKLLRRLIGEDIDLAWLPGRNMWQVNMDPSQVDQILVNLCVNARDAITGVGKVTIETRCVVFDETYCAARAGFLPGEYVMLAVSDNGCGMDKETLNNLFEPFFTTKEVGKGTGLGLAMIYGIVRQNNGFINVYSEPGQGATFKIYLPRYAGGEGRLPVEGSTGMAVNGNETILLVEDEPTILRMTATMIGRLGYTVLAAATPGEALGLAGAHVGPISLLLTDVVMPEMNGRDLARQLLSLHPDLKVLFMSGYTANVIAHHGVLDKGVEFIEKPFTRKGLAAKIRRILG